MKNSLSRAVFLRRDIQKMPAGEPGVGGNFMEERFVREKLIQKIAALAFADPTDAVRLAFLPEGSDIAGLDVSMVTDVKVGDKGGTQVKLVDRLELIRLLVELVGTPDREQERALEFFRALNGAGNPTGDGDEA